MAIVLTFSNPNKNSARVNIYRSNTKLDKSNLGEPIATLPGDAVKYVDETAVGGAEYFYMVEVTDGVDSVYTVTPSIINVRTRGPGPSVLQQGDRDCGFYGLVSASELPTLTEAFGAVATTVSSPAYAIVNYYKFAWKGRIIYIADSTISSNVNNEYYNTDMVKCARSGLKFNFDSPLLQASAEKPNIHTAGGYKFHGRFPRNSPEDWDGELPMTHPDVIMNPDTEFNQLVGAMARAAPPYPRKLCGLPVTNNSYTLFSSIMTADVEKTTPLKHYPSLRWQLGNALTNGVYALTPSILSPYNHKVNPAVLTTNGYFFSSRIPVVSPNGYENATMLPVFELIED